MTGGAFKNSSNLLARRREVEELETKTNRLLQEIAQIKNRREDLLTAIELNAEELEQVKETCRKNLFVRILQRSMWIVQCSRKMRVKKYFQVS